MTTTVLVTGASGFVGRRLLARFAADGLPVIATSRRPPVDRSAATADEFVPADLADSIQPLRPALSRSQAVIHLAAQVHLLRPTAAQLDAFVQQNSEATLRLAREAVAAGVRRFVFVSTIKVNGEVTGAAPFTAGDAPLPEDAYGRSKLAAEDGLRRIAEETGLELVIVRPPLVYGPGVRGNFLRLLALARVRVPLPLGSIHNSRSLISVWNLCDLLALAVRHPGAAGRVWLCSDGQDLSTPELLRRLAIALGRRPRLFPCPPALLRTAGSVLGRRAEIERLCGSLRVDDNSTRRELGWSPPMSIDEGLARTCNWYRATQTGVTPT